VPIRQWEKSPGGSLRCVIRAIPIAILRQVIGASEAVSFTCLGLRNSIDNDLTADEDDMLNFHHIPESETI
jgi:autophagy-related protein 2